MPVGRTSLDDREGEKQRKIIMRNSDSNKFEQVRENSRKFGKKFEQAIEQKFVRTCSNEFHSTDPYPLPLTRNATIIKQK